MKVDADLNAYVFKGAEYIKLSELKRALLDDTTRFVVVYGNNNDAKKFVAEDSLICKECANRSKIKYNHLGELKYFCPKVEKYVPDDGYCYMGVKRDE